MCSAPVFIDKNPSDAQLVTILDNHYGDGIVYIPEHTPWSLYTFARRLGYISEEGYVTKKGRSLLNSFRKEC